MAEQEDITKDQGPTFEIPKPPGPVARILPWLVPAVVVIVFAAGGFLIGRLFGTRGSAQTVSGAEPGAPAKPVSRKPGTGENWYYNLDPVVVNLNDPGVSRYIRAGLTLEISGVLNEKDTRTFLDQKKPLMKHWLTLYLSNQRLEDTRGERNMVRMQTQISETLNNGLFPGEPPHITSILLQEFAIQ
jgi:flagellar basal body-associated protein FliL